MLLLGERDMKREQIAKIESAYATVPDLRSRVDEIGRLLEACQIVITSDHPKWTIDHIIPARPFAHKIPVKLGSATKLAYEALRLAEKPLTGREIAREVLRRSGQTDPHRDTITKVANTIGNSLRKRHARGVVANDGEWPARWWVVKPS
ncbi:MAG: hypothetical protein KF730_05455 [Sphingomonas sp.]|uniref:hypothetical protein n=1 Tax=Sphingomonas sp. TaxID=28214 RepID=UPI0025CFF78F|nr:hypothetical protein [Sphingomonas sp.]MBX3564008.1 hypothetical protein [Sphingomonas sp.]